MRRQFSNQGNAERIRALFTAGSGTKDEVASAFFGQVHHHMPGILFSADPADVVLTVNPHGAELLGYRVDELLARPIASLLVPEDSERLLAQLAQCRQELGAVFRGEFRKVRKDGSILWVRESASAFRFAGQIVTLVLCEDITERKQMESQLQEQFEQLKALDRLKTNFVNSVTHELRTPLTSIMGYAEFLEDGIGGRLTSEQIAFVHQLQSGAKRLEHLLNDLLDFARLEAGTFRLTLQTSDLDQKIREVASSLLPQALEAQLRLRVTLPDEPLSVTMDGQRIGQVLLNLIGNSIKFTPPGGMIVVRAGRTADGVCVEVEDTGIGIPPADLPKLFRRFTQLEAGLKRGVGAGLGLSISKAIIEAHGGEIGVDSQEGKGSTFWFRLPFRPPGSGG